MNSSFDLGPRKPQSEPVINFSITGGLGHLMSTFCAAVWWLLPAWPTLRARNQCEHLLFHSSLSSLVTRHPTVHFTTVWSLAVLDRPTDSTACFKALVACHVTLWASLNHVQSATYCKAVACERAFSWWAAEWTIAACACLYPSFVHNYTVVNPPNGDNHPLWKEAVQVYTDLKTGKSLPVYSWHTTTTALCLAVGHALTSDYSCWFHPDIPTDQLACRCDWPSHLFHHPCMSAPAATPSATKPMGLAQPLDYFFHTGAQTFLEYLQATCLGFKLPSDPSKPFDLGSWSPPLRMCSSALSCPLLTPLYVVYEYYTGLILLLPHASHFLFLPLLASLWGSCLLFTLASVQLPYRNYISLVVSCPVLYYVLSWNINGFKKKKKSHKVPSVIYCISANFSLSGCSADIHTVLNTGDIRNSQPPKI